MANRNKKPNWYLVRNVRKTLVPQETKDLNHQNPPPDLAPPPVAVRPPQLFDY